jgi:arsenate reductase
MKPDATLLTYDACGTCKKARKWLDAHRVAYAVRAIVAEPPTPAELAKWIAASGKPVRKWLNTSGLSYRAKGGKTVFDAASDAEIARWLTEDGKLVKRPVLILTAERALVGFDEDAWREALR